MTTAHTQTPTFNRRRSNTASGQPLQIGDKRTLQLWVTENGTGVSISHSQWPGVAEGDTIRVYDTLSSEPSKGCLFVVGKDDAVSRNQRSRVAIPKGIADLANLKNNASVTLIKVDPKEYLAAYVELVFKDQYLGRSEMWQLGQQLVDQCLHTNEEVMFLGSPLATVQSITLQKGISASAAVVTSQTKFVFRSLSAKVTIFVQVCRELFEFADDGERYAEKVVHSFLPALFEKWKDANTNHTVSIVLISRVFYDTIEERKYAAGPLREDENHQHYKDFYKVITDLEIHLDWSKTLVALKKSFWDFQRDILLTHHYHRSVGIMPSTQARLVGRLSCAHDGPILEALNLGLRPNETHFIDRSLSLTGTSTILITPGTGFFRVSKHLLRLTTTRILDHGFGLDLVSLAKPPLHLSPVFSFLGYETDKSKSDRQGLGRAEDTLWGGDIPYQDRVGKELKTLWWEPFWVNMCYWDLQLDLPIKEGRFVARAKMHDIQMLGLLDHDVMSSISIPYLSAEHLGQDQITFMSKTGVQSHDAIPLTSANAFDQELFSPHVRDSDTINRQSFISLQMSSGASTIAASSLRSLSQTERTHRNSITAPPKRISRIEESPRTPINELQSAESLLQSIAASSNLSSSPRKSSVRSQRSNDSDSTKVTKNFIASRLTPSWLFNPFKSQPSEPETSTVSPLAITQPHLSDAKILPENPSAKTTTQHPKPLPIKSVSRSHPVNSPRNTPPREDTHTFKRRGTTGTVGTSASSNLGGHVTPTGPPKTNPSHLRGIPTRSQTSLANRWHHIGTRMNYKHQVNWTSLVTPACLPLTVEEMPSIQELEQLYDVFSYEFVVAPAEMKTFLVKPVDLQTGVSEEESLRKHYAKAVMRGMAAVRLVQGFQFVLQGSRQSGSEKHASKSRRSFVTQDDLVPRVQGGSEVLNNVDDPIYLSMSNEIHRIAYTRDNIQVRRYVRRMPSSSPFPYEYLIWPKLGEGYSKVETSFVSHGAEGYGWNRLDMLVAGYEHQLSFSESLRYWRTRFVVIPMKEPPQHDFIKDGESLNDEEIRLLGIEKLADMFTKLRWSGDSASQSVKFIPTTLRPASAIQDETVLAQLDEIHASGNLKKKVNSTRDIGDLREVDIVNAMREEDGVPFKNYQWHNTRYPDSFTGADLVSWLVREFRDVSSRQQGVEWGTKLLNEHIITHCRGAHGFLDGTYFYKLVGDYATTQQLGNPRRWFSPRTESTRTSGINMPMSKGGGGSRRPGSSHKRRKRLILSQSMIIDIDPSKKSENSECVILHHDVLHNPETVFHFELQWIGTTAKCIEDRLQKWTLAIERYGLRLVEAYVSQISDIRQRNAFQSCFPIRLAAKPPIIPEHLFSVPEGMQTRHYFEHVLLQRFDFILDVEAADAFSEQVDVVYSYMRSRVNYSQYVHRTGVAFVQVLGGENGFLFLTNRLMGSGRNGGNSGAAVDPATEAKKIREDLNNFCTDEESISNFYLQEIAKLVNISSNSAELLEPDELNLGEPLLEKSTSERHE